MTPAAGSLLRSACFCTLLLAAVSASAEAQTSEGRTPKESPLMRSDLAGWKARASLAEESIRKGDFKRAESAANSLIRDITRKITGGPDAGRILAMPLSLRALARIGLKREDDALWDYQMTAVLWPGVKNVRLESYGPPGVRLAELAAVLPVQPPQLDVQDADASSASTTPKVSPEITPPRALGEHEIEFPEALGRVMKHGQVTIDLIIDATGRLSSPTIRPGAPQNALFLFSAMEGVRDRRFAPAMVSGKPIPVFYSLTVNFK